MGITAGVAVLALAVGLAFFFMAGDGEPREKMKPGSVLRVGMECGFAPYNWEEGQASDTNLPLANSSGNYAEGYDVQIIRMVIDRLGAEVKVLKVPWGDLLGALNNGQIDMVASGMADTAARRELVAFSDIYNAHPAEYSIMVRKDSRYVDASTLADFYKARVVGQKDTMLDVVIDQIYGVQHLPPVATVPDLFRQLEQNEADAVVINTESAQSYLKEYPNLAVVKFARNEGFNPGFKGICVGVRKEDKGLLRAVNKALSDIPLETRLRLIDQMTTKAEQAEKVL